MALVWKAAATPPAGVPASLAKALHIVERDILGTPEILARFPEPQWSYDPKNAEFSLLDLSSIRSIRIFGELEMIVEIAEITSYELAGYEGIQWPPCHGHKHLLEPTAFEDEAWWICPSARNPVVRIGQFTVARPDLSSDR